MDTLLSIFRGQKLVMRDLLPEKSPPESLQITCLCLVRPRGSSCYGPCRTWKKPAGGVVTMWEMAQKRVLILRRFLADGKKCANAQPRGRYAWGTLNALFEGSKNIPCWGECEMRLGYGPPKDRWERWNDETVIRKRITPPPLQKCNKVM